MDLLRTELSPEDVSVMRQQAILASSLSEDDGTVSGTESEPELSRFPPPSRNGSPHKRRALGHHLRREESVEGVEGGERLTQAIKAKLREELQGGRSVWRKIVTGDRDKSVRQHLREKRAEPRLVRLVDKLIFSGGVLCLLASEFVVLRYPGLFWLWYSVVIPPLLVVRYIEFRAAKWLYFLIDFCYFGTFLCLLGIHVLPTSHTLFLINFAFANGPLAWAVVAWLNSLVFHSVDKVTSVTIHLFPAALMYCRRWHPTSALFSSEPPSDPQDTPPMNFGLTLGLSLLLYSLWQLSYFFKTEFLDKRILDSDPDLQTSLRWLSRDRKNGMHQLVLRITRKLGVLRPHEVFDSRQTKTKVIFMASQFIFTLFTLLPVPLFYHSQVLHAIFIIAVLVTSIFRGGGYYIEVFSVQYASQFPPMKTD